MTAIQRADWVRCKRDPASFVGIVKRVARNGAWADVDWHTHTKRMPASSLEVLSTIPFGEGTVTDMTRERELFHDGG